MDFEYIHKELARPNVTLTLLHDEYVQDAHEGGKIPYAYRTFARHCCDYTMKYKAPCVFEENHVHCWKLIGLEQPYLFL